LCAALIAEKLELGDWRYGCYTEPETPPEVAGGPTSRLPGAGAAVVEFVLTDLAAKGVAVNSKDRGGAGLVAIRTFQNALDKTFLKFADGLVEEDAAFYHQGY
jgi:hypothetical protein